MQGLAVATSGKKEAGREIRAGMGREEEIQGNSSTTSAISCFCEGIPTKYMPLLDIKDGHFGPGRMLFQGGRRESWSEQVPTLLLLKSHFLGRSVVVIKSGFRIV
jgi:hypothetical protein